MDVLDPEAFGKCSRFKRPDPSWQTSDVSLSLLSSPLLQAATNPHGHHLCITIIVLYDEGVILKKKTDHEMIYIKNI